MQHPHLSQIFWHCLTGAHARYATGAGTARRYQRGFSPIVAFADASAPDFAALAPYCDPGERLYCEGWQGAAPPGWRIEAETTMFRMVWDAPAPLPASGGAPMVLMSAQHAAQALALATLCQPGPFGIRTPQLGDYLGVFEGGRLIAMAGERLSAPGLREISGVCTHPDAQGRGLARQLMLSLVQRQRARGETPFLHVMRDKPAVHDLYLRMGFKDYLQSVVRVIARE